MELNPKQLSVIMDWTIEKCYFYFEKVSPRPNDENGDPIHDKRWILPIADLEFATGLDISFLVKDVKMNFTRNKSCVDFVMRSIGNKIRPVKKYWEDDRWKFKYPKTVSIPEEVRFLLTPKQRKEISDNVHKYLPLEKLEIIKDHNILIR